MTQDPNSLYLNSWELATAVDGPGTRLVFFFSGCPLRCVFCHNPETWFLKNGKKTPLSEIEKLIQRYLPIFKTTNGGVTFIGGEALFQASPLIDALKIAKENKVHTCVDTSAAGFTALSNSQKQDICENTDLFLLDIKGCGETSATEITRQKPVQNGVSIWEDMFSLVRAASNSANKAQIRLRFVLIPDLTDTPEHLAGVKNTVKDLSEIFGEKLEIDVLPFHQMGQSKYDELQIDYPLKDRRTPSHAEVEKVKKFFADSQ